MKKWQKFILSLLLIFYAIPVANFVWPREFNQALQAINEFLPKLHIPKIAWAAVSFNTGLILLGILLLIWLIVLFAPIARLELLLHKDSAGQLELSNKSIASFTAIAVRNAGLVNPQVNVKTTKHRVKIRIKATTESEAALKPELEAIAEQLNHQLANFIGDKQVKIHTKILMHQKPHQEKARPRVV
ncbi:alkaline shock response membrane anchor protein AmaP [Periweissella fabaria]|uniref:Alkaline shock response membrane anchor protein AmaP n=1 Tax=Periweissella fabaria TaxID=546157 RepID=A0ABM8Z605_9LACO|nr:alkaline shock response membrane anchor protein AmaP [Periweissella fabaria]MCM0597292.1 alkaline shock response membrane anchor protein AmaP [Periweissella fabaria]CAH0416203.1 hypothetical protein WFA24289_00502 [Periweissella fabaria]